MKKNISGLIILVFLNSCDSSYNMNETKFDKTNKTILMVDTNYEKEYISFFNVKNGKKNGSSWELSYDGDTLRKAYFYNDTVLGFVKFYEKNNLVKEKIVSKKGQTHFLSEWKEYGINNQIDTSNSCFIKLLKYNQNRLIKVRGSTPILNFENYCKMTDNNKIFRGTKIFAYVNHKLVDSSFSDTKNISLQLNNLRSDTINYIDVEFHSKYYFIEEQDSITTLQKKTLLMDLMDLMD